MRNSITKLTHEIIIIFMLIDSILKIMSEHDHKNYSEIFNIEYKRVFKIIKHCTEEANRK